MNRITRTYRGAIAALVGAAIMGLAPQAAFAQGSANWQADWKKLTVDAKREGELNLILAFGIGGVPRKTLVDFEKLFGVKVNMQTLSSGSILAPKVLQEQQGGVFNYDVIVVSGPFGPNLRDGNALDPIRPALIRPDVMDNKVWAGGLEASFRDKEKQFGFASVWEEIAHFWVNTNLIKPEEIRVAKDLLKPQLRGKMMFQDIRAGSTLAAAVGIRRAHGDDVLKSIFVDTDPQYSRDPRPVLEALIKGQIIFGLAIIDPILPEFKAQGLTAHIRKVILQDTRVTSTGNDLWLPKRTPHPNAAKLFVNWMLTKEGQTIYTQDILTNSRRLDVPAFAPDRAVEPGVKYVAAFGVESEDAEFPAAVKILTTLLNAAPKK